MLLGFTPLILASTAGHAEVVEILIDQGADIEAQSERTKDTPLSLACSGGRYEVVEILLRLGANKEHRNVSDYTPLSLAASGGYVNIIKLLLSYGAEINSRFANSLVFMAPTLLGFSLFSYQSSSCVCVTPPKTLNPFRGLRRLQLLSSVVIMHAICTLYAMI